jgi:hypothetical protein
MIRSELALRIALDWCLGRRGVSRRTREAPDLWRACNITEPVPATPPFTVVPGGGVRGPALQPGASAPHGMRL